MTPERLKYAKMRVERLTRKLESLYRMTKTPDVRHEITSSQNAIRRWERQIREAS